MLRRHGRQAVAAAQMKLIWACPSGPRAPAESHRPGLWRPADRLAYQVRHAQRGTWRRLAGSVADRCACLGCGVMAETDLIRTPDQRLRVFVSSTLQELAAER